MITAGQEQQDEQLAGDEVTFVESLGLYDKSRMLSYNLPDAVDPAKAAQEKDDLDFDEESASTSAQRLSPTLAEYRQ